MLPTLWPGDLITVRSVPPEQVEPGEIVLYMRQNRFFIHRIVSKELTRDKTFLVTRGDCMAEDDPPIERSELLGRVTEVRRADSIFLPSRKLSPFRRLLAWMLCRWDLFQRVGLRLGACRRESNNQVEGAIVNVA